MKSAGTIALAVVVGFAVPVAGQIRHEAIVVCAAAAGAGTPITLDATRQLFLDDDLIASMTNVERRIHPARKHPANPLIWPSEEWEGKVALTHGSVIRDGDRYRMWYLSGPGVSYAESTNGVNWVKPELGILEIDGHGTNVVVRRDASAGEPNAFPYFKNPFGVNP